LLSALRQSPNATTRAEASAVSEIWTQLPEAARADVVVRPFFSNDYYCAVQQLLAGSFRDPLQTICNLGLHVKMSSLQAGCFAGDGLVFPLTRAGRLRLGSDGACPQATPLGPKSPGYARIVQPEKEATKHALLEGADIVVDSSDIRVRRFFDSLNERGDCLEPIRPRDANATEASALRRALTLVAGIWPEMHGEMRRYIRLIVPFAGRLSASFTDTTWHATVFLGNAAGSDVALLDRLVHEASHLRLNVVMASRRLHDHNPGTQLLSPFRDESRPVDGIVHGVFVFARVHQVLTRAATATSDSGFLASVGDIRAKALAGIDVLRRDGRLTDIGAGMIDAAETALGVR
jgi:HEXXH motif-containing protein